jgi:hypothetical protein
VSALEGTKTLMWMEGFQVDFYDQQHLVEPAIAAAAKHFDATLTSERVRRRTSHRGISIGSTVRPAIAEGALTPTGYYQLTPSECRSGLPHAGIRQNLASGAR